MRGGIEILLDEFDIFSNKDPTQIDHYVTTRGRFVTKQTLREFIKEAKDLFVSFRRSATPEETLFPKDKLINVKWFSGLAPVALMAEKILQTRRRRTLS